MNRVLSDQNLPFTGTRGVESRRATQKNQILSQSAVFPTYVMELRLNSMANAVTLKGVRK